MEVQSKYVHIVHTFFARSALTRMLNLHLFNIIPAPVLSRKFIKGVLPVGYGVSWQNGGEGQRKVMTFSPNGRKKLQRSKWSSLSRDRVKYRVCLKNVAKKPNNCGCYIL